MKRKIIRIDETLCNGCGQCVTACAEGALQLVGGKARLVKEQFCDGFGDCLGECPTGALTIEERESDAFDVEATKQHLRATQGEEAIRRMEAAGQAHEQAPHPPARPPLGGCPGMRASFTPRSSAPAAPTTDAGLPGQVLTSELQQWPVQLHLVQPGAPFFHNRELAVLSTCSPIASADAHWRFIRGRAVVVACPKLDDTAPYAEKLGAILQDTSIPRVLVVRMEVPCCGGLTRMVREAVVLSGRTDLRIEEVTLGRGGDVLSTLTL